MVSEKDPASVALRDVFRQESEKTALGPGRPGPLFRRLQQLRRVHHQTHPHRFRPMSLRAAGFPPTLFLSISARHLSPVPSLKALSRKLMVMIIIMACAIKLIIS